MRAFGSTFLAVAACATTPAKPAAAPERHVEAAPPPAPIATPVRDPWAAKIVIAGDEMHVIGAASDDAVKNAGELRALLDRLEPTLLPAASTCAGVDPNAATQTKKITVTGEAPHTGDLAIVVGEHESVTHVVEALRAVRRPAALIVRGESGERVLPLRLCPDAVLSAQTLPRTLEISAPGDLPMFTVSSSGGVRESALEAHPWGDGIAPLVHAISVYGSGAKVRVWLRGGVPVSSLVLAVDAAAASHARTFELDEMPYDPQVIVGSIALVQPIAPAVHQAVFARIDGLDDCLAAAWFADPSLASPQISLAIHAGRASLDKIEPRLDDATTACFARAVDGLMLPNIRGDKVSFMLTSARLGSIQAMIRRQQPQLPHAMPVPRRH